MPHALQHAQNPSTAKTRWEEEPEEFPEAHGLAGLAYATCEQVILSQTRVKSSTFVYPTEHQSAPFLYATVQDNHRN